jgi:phosphatidylserine/phosphatidylglycerophosphate/cardiolipin synthase-like enzyme
MGRTIVRAYASPGCVLLTFDWPDGKDHPDFLGFSILRDPGYSKDGKPQFLFNKLDFQPITEDAKPKGSDKAPIQKFNWWDGGIDPKDRGRSFTYTITPMLGTGAADLRALNEAAGKVKVTVPKVLNGKIASWFNRAVVSAQSFTKLKNSGASLEKQMDWLADGIQEAVPGILKESESFQCAIYHLTDQRWIIPALADFKGEGSIIYFDKNNDHASAKGLEHLPESPKITRQPRSRISKLMHNKFIVSRKGSEPHAVLMGSTNFTPEAQTTQANLLHVIHSPQLAALYAARHDLLATDPTTAKTAKGAGWIDITDVPGTGLRLFFLPEPKEQRTFLDTVVDAVRGAKSSVLFCMFTASDTALMEAIFAVGDSPDRLIYGLLNSIDDPDKPTKSGKPKHLPPISVEIFNRSQKNPDTLSYDRFTKADAPRGFLPELAAIDTSKFSGSEGPPIAIHVHHKFIVIDGNTDHPTIYTGSPNFSHSAENDNDENVLEIKGNTELAQVYVAEFMRLYNHYRARALWDKFHGTGRAAAQPTLAATTDERDALVLKTTRDGWAKGAYTPGSKAFLARTRFL